jgi:hypothetical protein
MDQAQAMHVEYMYLKEAIQLMESLEECFQRGLIAAAAA